jgi:hypothetical protein
VVRNIAYRELSLNEVLLPPDFSYFVLHYAMGFAILTKIDRHDRRRQYLQRGDELWKCLQSCAKRFLGRCALMELRGPERTAPFDTLSHREHLHPGAFVRIANYPISTLTA